MVIYRHKKPTGLFILKSAVAKEVNGRVLDEKPIILHFENHLCDISRMHNAVEVEALMDEELSDPKRPGLIRKMPSKERVKKIDSAVKKLKKAKEKAVEKALEKDPELKDLLDGKEEFDAFVKKAQASGPQLTKGMRDVHK